MDSLVDGDSEKNDPPEASQSLGSFVSQGRFATLMSDVN